MKKVVSIELAERFAQTIFGLGAMNMPVVLAVSGGSDSMAMLHLAARVYSCEQLRVGFVDHGLRGGIDKEWDVVASLCAQLGVAAERLRITDRYTESAAGEGIQQWARQRRYQLLESLAEHVGAKAIFTGHTLDDQAETVMLRLLRGSGIDGLGAIPPIRRLNGNIRVIRPVLQMSRGELRDWLSEHGILWVEDPSNQNEKYTRVRVRELLPSLEKINPAVKEHLSEIAGEARNVAGWFDDYFDSNKFVKTIVLGHGYKVEHKVFMSVSEGLWGRLIRAALQRSQGNLRRFGREHIRAILEGIRRREGARRHDVPGTTSVWTAYGDLYVFPDEDWQKHNLEEQKMELPASNQLKGELSDADISFDVAVTDADAESLFPLYVRAARPGDRLYRSSRKLGRLLIDRKIPQFYRHLVPVMCTEKNEVVSAPGILNSRVSGLRMVWRLHPECALRDLTQFADLIVL